MGSAAPAGSPAAMPGAPASLTTLLERFDPAVLELPRERTRVRLAVRDGDAWDAVLTAGGVADLAAANGQAPDTLLAADTATWRRIARELPAGMNAYRAGRLRIRRNLGLGVGFLAATSGDRSPERLRMHSVRTAVGRVSALEAGSGPPVVLLHGLGGTKVSFVPTIAALAAEHRMIAIDLPGFGDSDKPVAGGYDARFFARWVEALLDALGLDRVHLVGHSMGGRAALEVGFRHHDRLDRLVLMTPSLAWLRGRPWAPWLRLVRPELGLLQPAPRIVVERIVRRLVPGSDGEGWVAAAVDEFLRVYTTPRGRAAFYAAARAIYLEEPEPFWQRMEALAPESLFLWGRRDPLVPKGFMRHVERRLPSARHVELDCGHIPQLERPREAHGAIAAFLAGRG